MNDLTELLPLIDVALQDVSSVVAKSKWMNYEEEPIKSTQAVLTALKTQVSQNPAAIDERVLRGMHNLGMSAFKDFENTPLEESIGRITAFLRRSIPKYGTLKPLGRRFR